MTDLNNINKTVGNALMKYKDQLNECYSRKGDLAAYVQNIFDLEDINNNPYTIEVINNLRQKRNPDSQIMYIYNIFTAGCGLRSF